MIHTQTHKYDFRVPGAPVANYRPRHNRILRNYHSENEGKAYEMLHIDTPFGSGAQKMTDEFAEMQGKEVEAFWYDALAPGVFDFTIYFLI